MSITDIIDKSAADRIILHSDCNGFYASVECLHNPKIRSKPVAVGGDAESRHGIILAKNEIAKKYKIKTGETIWQARLKCPSLVIVPPHFDRYKRFSRMARRIYADYTDKVEPFGLDEAWLDLSGNGGKSGKEFAEEIRARIKSELGITVSIGVSFNKIFAKFGSDYKKPDAVTEITRDNFRQIVWDSPSENLLYVGRATKKKLADVGIYTIGDIANSDVKLLRSHLGKWGELIYGFANGYDSSPVARIDEVGMVKSIGNSVTTPKDMKTFGDVKQVVTVLCDSVCRRMREQGLMAKTVCISARSSELCSFTRQRTLEEYTNLTHDITDTALELFKQNRRTEKPLRSAGVSVSDFICERAPRQMNLLKDEKKLAQYEKLDKTIDAIKKRFGCRAVRPAILLENRELSDFNPMEEHTIHPIGYF